MSAPATRPDDPSVSVSVIVPVGEVNTTTLACARAVGALNPAPQDTVLVLDGCDADGRWPSFEGEGVTVIPLPEAVGPARARNLGAGRASGDVLLFLDADVLPPPDAIQRVSGAFEGAPDLQALFGCYDDAPQAPETVSQYRNLLHHYTHMTALEDASTFWTGCGAVRREAFFALGGFDERYSRPSIEDVAFGCRLKRAGGRIRLQKSLRVKHLKRWRLLSMVRCDLLDRAVPWTRLILRERCLVNDLNLKTSARLSAACASALLLTLAGALWVPELLAAAALLLVALAALNAPFYRFLMQKRGGWFALKAFPLHVVYHLCCSLGFAVGTIRHVVERNHGAAAPSHAFEDLKEDTR